MSGDWLAMGAVALLAAASTARRGSRSLPVVERSPESLVPTEEVRDQAWVQALAARLRVDPQTGESEIDSTDLRPLFVLSDSLTIVDGHHRRAAALLAGLQQVPVVLVPEDEYEDLIDDDYMNDEAVEQLTGHRWCFAGCSCLDCRIEQGR